MDVLCFGLSHIQVADRGAQRIKPLLKPPVESLSKLLFTRYLLPFEVLSVFLLVLIVAIFTIARPVEVK